MRPARRLHPASSVRPRCVQPLYAIPPRPRRPPAVRLEPGQWPFFDRSATAWSRVGTRMPSTMSTVSLANRLRGWRASIGPRWSMMRSAADFEPPTAARAAARSGSCAPRPAVPGPPAEDSAAGPCERHPHPGAAESVAHPEELSYYIAYCLVGASLDELIRVAGSRRAIEECPACRTTGAPAGPTQRSPSEAPKLSRTSPARSGASSG